MQARFKTLLSREKLQTQSEYEDEGNGDAFDGSPYP